MPVKGSALFHISFYPGTRYKCTHCPKSLNFVSVAFKGSLITKALTCMYIYLYKQKMAILSRRLILLTILLYEQFIHYTKINLHPNKQLLSTQKQAYQSIFELLPALIPFAS